MHRACTSPATSNIYCRNSLTRVNIQNLTLTVPSSLLGIHLESSTLKITVSRQYFCTIITKNTLRILLWLPNNLLNGTNFISEYQVTLTSNLPRHKVQTVARKIGGKAGGETCYDDPRQQEYFGKKHHLVNSSYLVGNYLGSDRQLCANIRK